MKKQRLSKKENIVGKIMRERSVPVRKVIKCLLGGAVLFAIVSTTGCMGLAMRHLETGKTRCYSDLKNAMTPPLAGSGRLFIYVVGGGPTPLNTLGLLNVCTVDEHVYKIMGDTYWYVDLPAGIHKVTAQDVRGFRRKRYGKNVVEFDLKEGDINYCRIALSGFGAFTKLTPVKVESPIAEQEMARLNLYKNTKMNQTVK